MHYLIYKITNRLNNKFYVGKHKTENKDDGYFGSGVLIERAVAKHGRENFVKEILFELPTEEDMNQKEADIVDEEFVARDDTYNLMAGGQGGGSTNWDKGRAKYIKLLDDPEFQERFHQSLLLKWEKMKSSGYKSNWIGRKHTEETIRKMREAKIGKYNGKKNPVYGKHWITDGTTSKMVDRDIPTPTGWRKGRA